MSLVNEELGGYLAATHLIHGGACRLVFSPACLDPAAGSDGAWQASAGHCRNGSSLDACGRSVRPRDRRGSEVGRQILRLSQLVVVVSLRSARRRRLAGGNRSRNPATRWMLVVGYDDNHFASESSIRVHS